MSKGYHSSVNPLMTIKNELLHAAVVRGELPTVRRLLDRHRADINTRNSNGLSCLQLAILDGHTKLAEFLIQKGIDIQMMDPDGFTALHDAALVENAVLVKKLIAKGVSPLATTQMGELAIDVAGSLQMEKLLCEEMHRCGELELAKQYYIYLGISKMEDTKNVVPDTKRSLGNRGSHSYVSRSHQKHHLGSSPTLRPRVSSPKAENKNRQTVSQVSKNFSTFESRIHPNVKNANSALKGTSDHPDEKNANSALKDAPDHPRDPLSSSSLPTTAKLGPVPIYGIDDTGSHKNVGGEEVYKRPLQLPLTQTNSSSRVNQPTSCSTSETDREKACTSAVLPTTSANQHSSSGGPTAEIRCTGNPISQTRREYAAGSRGNSSPEISREEAAIKALHRHSNFQLQIGLSLQSEQFSTLDQEEEERDQFSLDPSSSSPSYLSNSKFSETSSPSILSRRNSPSALRTGGEKQQQSTKKSNLQRNPLKQLQKTVSFADLPMTRSKTMFVGPATSNSDNSSESPPLAEPEVKDRPRSKSYPNKLHHSQSLPPDILRQYISRYKDAPAPAPEEERNDETDGMFDAGIRALSLKPRKSSIACSVKRRNSEETHRRRSVTFQPEVLLQEIVTDGDVKAVSAILESGMIEDVNKMSPSGLMALHQSAIDGNLECAKTLVANGANVNCVDCENWTPLHAAVMNGSVEFVRFLLTSGAKPDLKNDNGETAYDMTKVGPIRKMLLHAMNGKSLDANDFSDGEYSGEEEEEYNDAESESDDDLDGSGLFDSNGEKTSLKERLGLTHASALNNVHTNSISPSPDLDNVFSSGSQVQFQKRDQELTDSTSSYGSLYEPDDTIKRLDKQFISEGKQNTSKLSSNVESDTDKISESGISTMEGSSDNSHRSRVLSSEDEDIMLDSDLDPGSLDYEFQEACLHCDVDRVLKLVKYKYEIEVNRMNKMSGITALHHSVLEENFALVQHLVNDFEANLHVRDIEGWTPLHAASAVGNIQIAQFLLDRGAKASSLNLSCEFPVDVAEDEALEKLLKNAMLGYSVGKGVNR